MKKLLLCLGVMVAVAPPVASAQKKEDDAHRKQDIQKHRVMAAAHEAAAKCLEAGKEEKTCHEELRNACKGIAVGRYCGMRHEH